MKTNFNISIEKIQDKECPISFFTVEEIIKNESPENVITGIFKKKEDLKNPENNSLDYYKSEDLIKYFEDQNTLMNPMTNSVLSKPILFLRQNSLDPSIVKEFFRVNPKIDKDVSSLRENIEQANKLEKRLLATALDDENCMKKLAAQTELALKGSKNEALSWVNTIYDTILTSYPLQEDSKGLGELRDSLSIIRTRLQSTFKNSIESDAAINKLEICIYAICILLKMKVETKTLDTLLQKTTKETLSLALLFSADAYLNQHNDLSTSKAFLETVLHLEKVNAFATKCLEQIQMKQSHVNKLSLTHLFNSFKKFNIN